MFGILYAENYSSLPYLSTACDRNPYPELGFSIKAIYSHSIYYLKSASANSGKYNILYRPDSPVQLEYSQIHAVYWERPLLL